jgi:hypothetical protein
MAAQFLRYPLDSLRPPPNTGTGASGAPVPTPDPAWTFVEARIEIGPLGPVLVIELDDGV